LNETALLASIGDVDRGTSTKDTVEEPLEEPLDGLVEGLLER